MKIEVYPLTSSAVPPVSVAVVFEEESLWSDALFQMVLLGLGESLMMMMTLS